ncbi:GIY-YIG nuclease family protein [Aeromicrobium sp. CTD01-1L150]|uniref:GIY-YIG nuclease family protein n=1 Tax=Aeromicrobium sp. CTD01-1L150 TaxID=3341830 RepID=UPI0035C1592D
MAWVYMLRCADDSYYVGSTRNLDARLWQHNHSEHGAAYTRRRRPVELVWSWPCESVAQAYWLEKRIQGWGRAKREALIRRDYDALPALAKKNFRRSGPTADQKRGSDTR